MTKHPLRLDDYLKHINVLKGKIIIEPILPKHSRLDDLLAGITSDNIHAEKGFGSRVGKEIL
jgi:antitoxin MazE